MVRAGRSQLQLDLGLIAGSARGRPVTRRGDDASDVVSHRHGLVLLRKMHGRGERHAVGPRRLQRLQPVCRQRERGIVVNRSRHHIDRSAADEYFVALELRGRASLAHAAAPA
jgi:hypothetical protein